MELLIATADMEAAVAIAAADAAATLLDPTDSAHLHADLSDKAVVRFPLPSVKALSALASAIWRKVEPLITAKPKMEITIEGPFGKITLALTNVSEAILEEGMQKVFTAHNRSKRQ
jgi:hypothetical protein